jgi:hypothetical protein
MTGSLDRDSDALRPAAAARASTRRAPGVVIAVLVLVAVVTAGVLLPLTGSELLATATLQPLADGYVAEAHAELVTDDDERLIEIDALDLPAIDGYHELWLMTRQGDGLVSLGPVAERARVALPATIDAERFSVVDISREPVDGNPAHSTDSVLRGELRPAS